LLLLAPIVLTALLSAFFYYQARFDEGFRYYPYAWHAQWITSPYHDSKTACFRKTVFLPGQVQNAYLVVAADNFYELQVNDVSPNAFFRPGLSRTMPKDSTTYNALGYPRMQIGRIYNIGPYLHAGRNVITVQVQADSSQPRLAVQGVIHAGYRQEIVSDATWKCAPYEQQKDGVDWESVRFLDMTWAHAVSTGQSVAIPADGDAEVFDKPMQAYFIGAATSYLNQTARYRRTVIFPGKATEGWIRIATVTPYDFFLNGRLIGSTAVLDRYSRNLVSKRGDYDVLGRVQTTNFAYQYPSARVGANLDVYLLRNVFRTGPNLLEVTLHPREASELRNLPTFYLDGRIAFSDGSAQTLGTDGAWQSQVEAGGERWQAARIASYPGSRYVGEATIRIRNKIDAGGGTYARISRNTLIFALAFLGLTFLMAVAIRLFGKGHRAPLLPTMSLLCVPTTVVLAGGFFAQAIFISSPQDIYFSNPLFAHNVLIVAAVAGIGALLVVCWQARRAQPRDLSAPVVQSVERLDARLPALVRHWGFAAAIALIMLSALSFYLHGLGNDDYLPDEYVSILAARGILHRGIPIFEHTGIIYTRSALYHYLLAGSLALSGGVPTPLTTRLIATLWQLALIPLVYLFGREIKSRKAGLAAAALTAFTPYMIYYAREARFYTELAFFTTLTFYLLLKSVRNPDRNGYRVGVVLAFCGAYLSQQFAFAMIPAIVLIIVFSGQTRAWLRRGNLAWILFAIGVMGADLYAYLKWCQTPLPFVDEESVLPLALHTDVLELLPSMLLSSNERAQLPLGLLFLGGLVYMALRLFRAPDPEAERPAGEWSWGNYLYLSAGLTILVTTLTSSRPANRYIVHVVPLVALIAACAAQEMGQSLYRLAREATGAASSARLTQWGYALGVALVCAAAYRPVRVWNTSERSNNRGISAASRYVAQHQRLGDKIMYFSPEVAMVELNKCDYMWRPRRGSIFKYLGPDGRLRERNSGAVVVDNADKLRRVLASNQRVWLVIHPSSIGTPGPQVSGEMAQMLQDNFQIVYEPFSMEVLLWDRSQNTYRDSVRNYGFDQYNF
jgi:4-amino-4-deoxy-L-arabinose transferase-like glycosyltransferase